MVILVVLLYPFDFFVKQLVPNKLGIKTVLHTESGSNGLAESSLSRSILESVDMKGGSIAVGVEFCATVQRIFKLCGRNAVPNGRFVIQL
jgi:hypothetical protein